MGVGKGERGQVRQNGGKVDRMVASVEEVMGVED